MHEATERGVSFRRHGTALRVRGPVDVIDELRLRIAAAKSEILALLAIDAEVSAGGRLCGRCQKIGRVDRRGVCTFCLADARRMIGTRAAARGT